MADSASALTPLDIHDGRQNGRTHMFVAATLYSGAGSCPVHVRNMSLTGALIEGAVLPDPGVQLTLRRGSLEARARVVWRADRRAGIAFSGAILVADWMSRNPPSHQARIDDMIREVRSRADLPGPVPPPAPSAPGSASIETELTALKAELERLENGLTGDPAIIASHPEIQLLDIALQRVGRLLASLPRD